VKVFLSLKTATYTHKKSTSKICLFAFLLHFYKAGKNVRGGVAPDSSLSLDTALCTALMNIIESTLNLQHTTCHTFLIILMNDGYRRMFIIILYFLTHRVQENSVQKEKSLLVDKEAKLLFCSLLRLPSKKSID
jgi:hypothetical protein